MPHITLSDPIVGQPDSSEEPKIPTDLDIIANVINGGLDATNLATSFLSTVLRVFPANAKIATFAMTITWPGGTPVSNPSTISLAGATGLVSAVGAFDAINIILDGVVFDWHANGSGGITARGICITPGHNPAGGTSVNGSGIIYGQ